MTSKGSTTPLNFAPYSEPPNAASARWAPPPVASTSTASYQSGAPVTSLGQGTSFSGSSQGAFGGAGSSGGGGVEASSYAGLGYGSALEAAAAYALGPFGACALLMYEAELDYVRFHAWQSALLCMSLFGVHLVFLILFSSRTLQNLLIWSDLILLALLSWRAYRDAGMEVRYELPVLGALAQSWVAEE
ncbi:hypothetical protein RQP46_005758 [Phenoliferia psychrophenolica]